MQLLQCDGADVRWAKLTVLSTSLDNHIANGHAVLHGHGLNGLARELHCLVCTS